VTIGTGSYNPSPDFAFPRSYVRGIDMYFGPNALVVWTGNDCFFQDLSNPNVSGHFVILPQFVAWSSNRYTLGFLPQEFYYQVFPDPTEIPASFYLNWGATVDGSDFYIVVNIFGAGTVRHRHELPSAPADYWYQIPPAFPP
jgi:hypothetical protein